jgi:hypothetical protein
MMAEMAAGLFRQPASVNSMNVAVDEDRIGDGERIH